ncbi:MAG: type VI secretion system baseplate subunit TssF [Planctomycetota bacterium]|nr:type VI secretion system baseplate subunit TssF [Planctomycetota bacterium]
MSKSHDVKFLELYTEELDYLRRMSGEFAKQFPAVAGRLDLTQFDCQDPWVERLLEGVAYLTSRVRRELDGGLPLLAQSLISIAEPRAVAPLPSFTMMEIKPAHDLAQGSLIPAGTDFETEISAEAGVPCRWKSSRDLMLVPARIVEGVLQDRGNPPGSVAFEKNERGWMELTIDFSRSRKHMGLGNTFDIHLQGPPELPGQVLMCLRSNCTRIAICDDQQVYQWLPASALVDAIDLQADDGTRGESGIEMLLMQRYAAHAQQFHGFSIRGIDPELLPSDSGRLKLLLVLEGDQSQLASRVETEMFLLHVVPLVNLVRRRTDRIILNMLSENHEVIVDRTRPMDYEVLKVDAVEGIDDTGKVTMALRSIYDIRDLDSPDTGFFSVINRPRPDSETSRRHGRRTSYRGTDSWLSLSFPGHRSRPNISQLSISAWCTNRDLPLLLQPGAKCHPVNEQPAFGSGVLITMPSRPRLPQADVTRQWSMLGHLGHGFMRIIDQPEGVQKGTSIQETLLNYIDSDDDAARQRVGAIQRVYGESVVRRRLVGRRAAEIRGFHCLIEITDTALNGGVDVYTLPLVLSRFLRRLIPVGSFLEVSVVNQQRKVLYSWTPMDGLDSTL